MRVSCWRLGTPDPTLDLLATADTSLALNQHGWVFGGFQFS